MDRRAARRSPRRRTDAAGGRGVATLRSVAARRGLPGPAPRPARQQGAAEGRMSETQARKVQAQFGAVADAYVTSAGHAGGEDLERLLAWGRALRPRRVLDVATGAGHTDRKSVVEGKSGD